MSDVAARVIGDQGGLLEVAGHDESLAQRLASIEGELQIIGTAGCGKTVLCFELVVQALARNKRVRIIDYGHSYLRITKALGGEFFEGVPADAALQAWSSEGPLVTLDAGDVRTCEWFDFAKLQSLPSETLVVCEEFSEFREHYKPLIQARTTVLVERWETDFSKPSKNRIVSAGRDSGRRPKWRWHEGEDHLDFRLQLGPIRSSLYGFGLSSPT